MKQIIYLFLFVVLFAGMLPGCQKEEVVAPQAVNGLNAFPGKYRAKVEFQVPQESASGKVFYGNGKFQEFTIEDPAALQSIVVDGLSEGEQIIRVVTQNKQGVTSDPKGVKVTVYGENYQQDLINRTFVDQKTLSPSSIEMFFSETDKPDEIGVRVLFTNLSGAQDSVMMQSVHKSVVVNNIDLNETYYFYSVYKPSADFIDEFTAPPVDAKVVAMKKLEKEVWKIAQFSNENPTRKSSNIIDDDAATFWQSENGSAQNWIVVDMQSEKIYDGFHFVQAPDPGDVGFANGFQFETSNDNVSWKTVLEGKFKANGYKQTIRFNEPVTSRYFKISILNNYGDAPGAQMAEIDLFNDINVSGENGENLPVLKNAKQPFTGDNSDMASIVGAGRFQKVIDWTHSGNARISYDRNSEIFCVWSAPVWGIPLVTNGKIYQTITLLPGSYALNIDAGKATNSVCADMYGIVAAGTVLPDFSNVPSAPEVLGYRDLIANQLSMNVIPFTITQTSSITIGVVYNTHNIYSSHKIPWSEMKINSFEIQMK